MCVFLIWRAKSKSWGLLSGAHVTWAMTSVADLEASPVAKQASGVADDSAQYRT